MTTESINPKVIIKQEDVRGKKTGKTLYSDILTRKRSKTDIERKSKVKQNKIINKNPT